MIDANPGGRFLLPGTTSEPANLYMGETSLVVKGDGWILEGGGCGASLYGGTTLRWDAGATGIIARNDHGTGLIRNMNLLGGERFTGAEGGTWPDAILPDFSRAIFSRDLQSMSRTSNKVTVLVNPLTIGRTHTYAVGTQITISGVAEHSYMNGLYYITEVSVSNGNLTGGFDMFSYECPGADVASFKPAAGLASISNTGTSTADGIVAGANFLRLENLNLEAWGRFGINARADSKKYWADNQNFRNISIHHGRGLGLYIAGGDANASDYSQMFFNVNLVGGICDFGFLGNTHIAPGVNYCGGGWPSVAGSLVAVSSLSCTTNVVTVTTSSVHGLVKGQAAVLAGLADSSFEPPSGSAVFVAEVVSPTQFTYNFAHADGSAGSGGTVRLATGPELYTVAGVGQTTNGSQGIGFSIWTGGAAPHVLVNPYTESGANGPATYGSQTLVIAGDQGAQVSEQSAFSYLGLGTSNITTFDTNPFGMQREFGTTVYLRGGHHQELPAAINFLAHTGAANRWQLIDNPVSSDPYFQIARGAYPGTRRLALFIGRDSYNIASAIRSGNVVTVTTTAPHGIGPGSFIIVSGVTGGSTSPPTTFNIGITQAYTTTDTTFTYPQSGPNESAHPNTGTVTSLSYYFDGESHLSCEGTGAVVFNYFGGTGGMRLCDGARTTVAAFDSAGKVTTYKGLATVGAGVPAQYADVSLSTQSASIGETNLYTAPSSGLYRISYSAKTTRAASTSGSVDLTFSWTDAGDSTSLTSSAVTLANSTGITGVQEGTFIVNAASSTNISYATTYSSSGATSLQYELRVRVEAM